MNLVLPPENFFTKYRICALPILRGLLKFTKVGFQTHRDRVKFLELVVIHLPTAKISSPENSGLDVSIVTYQVSQQEVNRKFLKLRL